MKHEELLAKYARKRTDIVARLAHFEAVGRKGGRSNDDIARLGQGRVYLNFILALHGLLSEKYGKRVMCWGDIILHHPELVAELPRDLIVLNWNYEAQEHYDQVEAFAACGLPQIHPNGYVEPPIVTLGEDLESAAKLLAELPSGQKTYTIGKALRFLREGA